MSAAFKNYHVTLEHAGLALVAALRKFLPGETWSAVRRLVENRHVQINGNLCVDEGRRLCEGDVVKIWDEPRVAPPSEDEIKILFQDAHLIVVEEAGGASPRSVMPRSANGPSGASSGSRRSMRSLRGFCSGGRASGTAASPAGRRGCGSSIGSIATRAA